jgi:hypothetical protein
LLNDAVIANGELIFRFPKHEYGFRHLKDEASARRVRRVSEFEYFCLLSLVGKRTRRNSAGRAARNTRREKKFARHGGKTAREFRGITLRQDKS